MEVYTVDYLKEHLDDIIETEEVVGIAYSEGEEPVAVLIPWEQWTVMGGEEV